MSDLKCMVCKRELKSFSGNQLICGNYICTKCVFKNLNFKFTCPYCSQIHELLPDLLLTHEFFKDKKIDYNKYQVIETEIYLKFKSLVDYLNQYILNIIDKAQNINETNSIDLKTACDNLRLQVNFQAKHAIKQFKFLEKSLQNDISFKFEKLIRRQSNENIYFKNLDSRNNLKRRKSFNHHRFDSFSPRPTPGIQKEPRVIDIIDYKSCKLTYNKLFKVNSILNLTQNFYVFCIAPYYQTRPFRHVIQIVDLWRNTIISERKIPEIYQYRKMCVKNSLILIGFKLKPYERHYKNELQLYDSNLKLRNSLKIDYEISSINISEDLLIYVTSLNDPIHLRLYNINLEVVKILLFKFDLYYSLRLKFDEFYKSDFFIVSNKKLFIEDQYSVISILNLEDDSLNLKKQINFKKQDFELVYVSQDSNIYLLNKPNKILLITDEDSNNLSEFNLNTLVENISSFNVVNNNNIIICDFINCKIYNFQLNFDHHS